MITTLDKYRPFKPLDPTITNKLIAFLLRINAVYFLQRSPMALLSSASAYGVYAFSNTLLPMFFSILAGIGIEAVYLGAIALADQLYDEDTFTTKLWWSLNAAAVIISALINTLFASHYTFSGITAESLVHALPLPILSFFYSLLLHRITNRNVARDYKVEQEQLKIEIQQKQYQADNPFVCSCGSRFKNKAGLSSHKRRSCKVDI